MVLLASVASTESCGESNCACSDSAAARKGYTEQIGLITAALYSPTNPRALGTKRGKEYKQHVDRYKGGKVPGELIGVLHVRYDEP